MGEFLCLCEDQLEVHSRTNFNDLSLLAEISSKVLYLHYWIYVYSKKMQLIFFFHVKGNFSFQLYKWNWQWFETPNIILPTTEDCKERNMDVFSFNNKNVLGKLQKFSNII